ncbi:MAG: carbohydrate-binding domain-containing protein [Clostridia bacterium]|nr:carbohydrate-binding domain-containing protein [Clostridia bacterium]
MKEYKMQKMQRKLFAICLCAALAGSAFLSGCSDTSSNTEKSSSDTSVSVVSSASTTPSSVEFDENDTDTSYNENESAKITLNGSSATVTGNGAKVSGSTVTITSSGTYIISGKMSDGNIVIDAGKKDVVKLVLDNAEITSKTTSAIYASQCEKTILLLNEGTTNTVSDGSSYVKSDTSSESDASSKSDTSSESDDNSDGPNAAIFVKDDLTILGSGTLNVTGNAHNGITGKDTVRISSGTINVTAAHHGITGKDNLAIEGGNITVTASSGDGLRSTYSKEDTTEKGNVYIENAEITVTAAKDGIQAEQNLVVNSGTINVVSGGGAAENKTSSRNSGGFGQNNQSSSTDSDSLKGLKSGSNLTVNNGTVTVNSYDDALHSNGDLTIAGGTINIQSGDDGIHTDNTLTIKNGKITVEQSYEGLEGNNITISGGTMDITSTDDGINCSGGNDQSGFGGMDGDMQFGRHGMRNTDNTNNTANIQTTAQTDKNDTTDSSSSETPTLTISGGTIYIDAEGDGLDSNGDVIMSGGTVVINGTTSGGNGILDHNGGFDLSGGTIIGAGTSDMLEMPSESSSQSTIAVLFDQSQSANTPVYITDNSGSVVAAITPQKSFGCVIFTSPELKSGETYKIYTGGKITGDSVHGYYSKAVVSGGSEYTSFTLSDTVTYVNSEGITTYSGGMGGMNRNFNQGQMPNDRQMPNNGQMPSDGQMPNNGQMPSDGQMPDNGQMPSDGQMPDRGGAKHKNSDRQQTTSEQTTL